jgi:2-polyprenyl-6-hydroxyphenyl methylase/3-demethylubiquinone-9 3-methyltransferase
MDESQWRVEAGSLLDADYLQGLGQFDIVYSWGVLHHTGEMWRAMDLLAPRVSLGGKLFIAIYNDQGLFSRWWSWLKRQYNRHPLARGLIVGAYIPYFIALRWLYRRLTGRGALARGMSLWHDMVDWLGGYPFEVASPEAVFRFCAARGFELRELNTAGSTGACNEFVFERVR